MLSKWRELHPGGKRILAIFLAIIISYAAIIGFISHTNDSVANKLDDTLSAKMLQKRYDVYTQITSVDPLSGEATARIEPWPLDDSLGYRYRSGWMPLLDVSLNVDAIEGTAPGGTNLYTFKNNVPTGGITATLDESSNAAAANISHYPFDKYTFEVPMSAQYTDASGNLQNLPILPQDYTKSIDTFSIVMKHVLWSDSTEVVDAAHPSTIKDAVNEYNQGLTSSIFYATRSPSTKLLTVIILLLMLTAFASVSTMAFLVSTRKRPPSLGALTWSAALTFSLIGLRGLFPGNPPIGIMIDKVVYFPALLATLVCSLSILIAWSHREDFTV